MIHLKDFEDEKGKIDWKAYNKAEEDAGERCYKCGSHIIFAKGFRTICYSCSKATDSEEFDHDCFLRCPKCKETWNPDDTEDYDVYADGEHGVICPECNNEFEITTSVSYSFTSPELVGEKDD